MKGTSIEWADNTANLTMGCTKVSEECTKCYMYRLMKRFGKDPYKINFMNIDNIKKNLAKWPASIIFVDSMSDFWHKDIPDEKIAEYFKLMETFSQHQYLVLTKRAQRMHDYVNLHASNNWPPKNIWFGVSCGIAAAKERIYLLQTTNVTNIKFVSFEPLLEDVRVTNLEGIDWVIVGGESDSDPRPMQKVWVDKIFNAAMYHGAAFFFKQWGGSKKCDCHKAWGCRMYEGKTFDQMPMRGITV